MINIKKEIQSFVSKYNTDNHEQAIKIANNLINKYPKESKLLNLIGLVFIKNKKVKDGIIIFKKILKIDPLSIEALINIGVAYCELNKINLSLEFFEKARNLNLRLDEIYFNMGVAYEKDQNIEKAILNYKKSIKYNSANINALNNLGRIYLLKNAYIKAKDIFEKKLSIVPKDPNSYHNIGIVLTKLNKFDEAIKFYSKAKKLNSINPRTYYNLGYLLLKKSKFNESVSNFKKAIKLFPNNETFYYNLALAKTELGKYDLAIKDYNKAICINNDYLKAKYNLARLDLATENFKSGWKHFEKRHHYGAIDNRIINILKLQRWNGKKFNGKLFIHGEQGIGDIILHSSMIQELYKIQQNICLTVDKRLVSLYRRSFKKLEVVSYDSQLFYTNNDRHVALASLGLFFRDSINCFPKNPKPYIFPCIEKVNNFKNILSKNKNIKIGVSWKSIGDRASIRTISLNQMSKILTIKGCDFINLQYGDSLSEINSFNNKF